MRPEIHVWCGLAGLESFPLPGVCALLPCVWDRSTQGCWPRAKGESSAVGGSCVKAGCGDPWGRRQRGMRGMPSAGPQLSLARAGRAGGSALVLLEARRSGSAGCWPGAEIQRPEIVHA